LPKLAVALPSPDGLARAAAAGADLVELRLDLFDGRHDPGRVIDERPLPVIATLRPPREGGRYDGPDAERLRLLLALARRGAEYVDLEWDAATPVALDDLRGAGARVIVSRHAFDRMPDLVGWAEEIAGLGPDVVKVVGTAREAHECAPALRALARAARPTIAIAMGEAGLATRVLALRYVEAVDSTEVAARLGVSMGEYYREHAAALAVAIQPRAAAPVAPSRSAAPPVATTAPIEGYAVEGTQGYEWRTKTAMDGYALVEGPFGYEVVGHGPAAPQAVLGDMVALRVDGVLRLVSAEDGYYDEGPSGYEWRLRPGR